jgi:hypothetical protein
MASEMSPLCCAPARRSESHSKEKAKDFLTLKNWLDPGIHSTADTILRKVPNTTRQYVRSGELAKITGVSTDTLRHYERIGVLARPPRTSGGYRQYPVEAADRVRLVRRAMAIGFSLDELARILHMRDHGGAPCRQVHALASFCRGTRKPLI